MTMTLRCVHLGEPTCTASCKAHREGGATCEPINSYPAKQAVAPDELMEYLYERQLSYPAETPVDRLAAALEVFAPHPAAKSHDKVIEVSPLQHAALIYTAKAEALRSAGEFFLSIDMPVAADHCVELAIGWEVAVQDGEEVDAWCEYRKDYGVNASDMKAARKAFKAGWGAHRDGDQSGVLR